MRADRLLSLLMLLQVRGQMTASELAEELEVSARTIYRDLDALSAAGIPVYAQRGPGGGCALLEHYRTNLTGLKEGEVRALFSLAVSGLLADLGVQEASESARRKLLAALPIPFQQDAQRVQKRLYLDASGWFQPEEPVPYLRLVQDAVWQSRRLRMRYRTADGTWIKQLVDPYGLVAKAGVWYVVAAAGGQIRVYRVSRVQEAALAEGTFERPASFDLASFWREWAAAFEKKLGQYGVTLRVAPQAGPALVAALGEGVYDLLTRADPVDEAGRQVIHLTFASVEDAARQLLGLGQLVEVIAPDELRERMRKMARRVAALYAGRGSGKASAPQSS